MERKSKQSERIRNNLAVVQNQIIDLEVSVRYTDCIRVIRMNMKNSLYDLHWMIQKAVDFDNDHLFEFSVGSGTKKRIYTLSETMNPGRELPVEETSLKDLELRKGQKFTYLFDFGDMWWFDIRVLDIREGTVVEPEVIKSVNDAPEQYPTYEEEAEEWQVVLSDQVQVSSILASIEDELIGEEYAALMGMKDENPKESPDRMRREMERILIENPKRMLAFMTTEMREKLSELLQREWIDSSERCTLAKLYSFGFCKWPEEEQDVIFVPASIKEIYSTQMKAAAKQDKIVETAEVFLGRCGVMETEILYSAVAGFLKSKISYEDFEFLVYSRLHYFGRYYCGCYDGTEYMSCYDTEMTQKILEEREKPENAVYDYPDFEKIYSKKMKESFKAMENWAEYVNFNLNIDWQTAQRLIMQIPAMAVSGVIETDAILAVYKEMLHGTGSRVTKKAERLIEELCTTMPLATQRGNTGLEEYDAEKNGLNEKAKQERAEEKREKESVKEEYTQLSIFDI